MGADQIGFLFKGPAKLNRTKKNIAAAEQRATEVYEALQSLRFFEELPVRFPFELRHFARCDMEAVLGSVSSLPEPKAAVKNLLDWWSRGARDTCRNVDPDDPKRVIGFAGDRTWGDEPDGVGYQTFKAAMYLDFLKFFGIR